VVHNNRVVDLQKLFQKELPFEFLRTYVGGLPAVYRKAREHVRANYFPAQAWDMLPHVRRCLADQFLWSIARRFPSLDVDDYLNHALNCHHVEARSDSIVLTSNAVNAPEEMVRSARFRDTLAESNDQWLFPYMDDRPRGDFYYAMILHGPRTNPSSELTFVYLGFPSPDERVYLGHYDLLTYCGVDLSVEIAEEIIEELPMPEIRENIQAQGE